MKVRESLYICGSFYTLLNSLILAKDQYDKAGVRANFILIEERESFSSIFKTLQIQCYIDNIAIIIGIRPNYQNILYYLALPKLYIKRHKIIERGLDRILKGKYKKIYCQNIFYASLFRRIFILAEYLLIEEGLSSYTGRTTLFSKRSNLAKIFMRFLGFFGRRIVHGGAYHYPELLVETDNLTIEKIPRSADINKNIIKSVFTLKPNVVYDNDLIYLGVPLYGLYDLQDTSRLSIDEVLAKARHVIDSLSDYCSEINKRIAYRQHPIEIKKKMEKHAGFLYDEINNPWDIQAAESINEEMYLFSFFSTAAFTPKIFFDKEPHLVFLFKTIDTNFFNAEKTLHNLSSLYRDKNKITIISSLNELREFIKTTDIPRS